MHWLLFGALILLASILGAQLFLQSNPQKLARTIRLVVGGLIALLALPILFRLGLGVGLPVLLMGAALAYAGLKNKRPSGWFRPGTGSPGDGGQGPGHKSNVETSTIRMTLDHATGAVDGRILSGPFRGRLLSALDISELAELFSQVRQSDPPSAELIQTYIERHRRDEWEIFREQFASAGFADNGFTDGTGDRESAGAGSRARGARSGLSVGEAREILGVSPAAGVDDIKAAHRAMMKKFHPDRGGSDYLAARINEAKDLLLSLVG